MIKWFQILLSKKTLSNKKPEYIYEDREWEESSEAYRFEIELTSGKKYYVVNEPSLGRYNLYNDGDYYTYVQPAERLLDFRKEFFRTPSGVMVNTRFIQTATLVGTESRTFKLRISRRVLK